MSGYKIYEKEAWQKDWGYSRETIIVKDGLVVAHLKQYSRPGLVDNTFSHPAEALWIEQILDWDRGFVKLNDNVTRNLQDWAQAVSRDRMIEHWAQVVGLWAREGRLYDTETE